MAMLSKQDVIDAFIRLGELAVGRGEAIELLLLGGSLMVLDFDARPSTHDVDVVILSPPDAAKVRSLAEIVSRERNWPSDWLNDAAKGFMIGISSGPVVFSAPGIQVRRPSIEQLLAMKICAWRDDVDIADARRLLQELSGAYNQVWQGIVPYVQPGRELKAKYAFDDLWEELHGKN